MNDLSSKIGRDGMAVNEYGAPLDSNGYAPSLIADGWCMICGKRGDLARHEPFGGPNRQKSKRLGLWGTICPACHEAEHRNPRSLGMLSKKRAERYALQHYGWSIEDFIREFGRNVL